MVGLASSYRYEGPRVRQDIAKSEAMIIHDAINDSRKNLIEDEEVVRILTTRSKPLLKLVCKYYKTISDRSLEEVRNIYIYLFIYF